MNKSFINKYMPQHISELIYDKDFLKTLNGLISMDYLNILIKGSQCMGKTSIITSIINDYYSNLQIDKDILKQSIYVINGLNEQGINGFRQTLKTFCQTTCLIPMKKKTIILDDIDLLNEQNQQIIRSSIDKYSMNINFIASCSNINKVIDSLQSRLNIMNVPPITRDNIKNILNNVVKEEKILLTDEIKDFLLLICDNSIKILLNNLYKIKLLKNKNCDLKFIKNICCHICYDNFKCYTHYWLTEKNIDLAINELIKLYNIGYSLVDILENYFLYIKHTTEINDMTKFKILPYICKYIAVFQTIHEDKIELYLFTYDLINNI